MLIATVNKDWSEFNPSPLSTRYFSVPDLDKLLQRNGFKVEFYGAFSTIPKTIKEKIISIIRKIAVGLHLIPKTMKGKELLKKIFYGKLIQWRKLRKVFVNIVLLSVSPLILLTLNIKSFTP